MSGLTEELPWVLLTTEKGGFKYNNKQTVSSNENLSPTTAPISGKLNYHKGLMNVSININYLWDCLVVPIFGNELEQVGRAKFEHD